MENVVKSTDTDPEISRKEPLYSGGGNTNSNKNKEEKVISSQFSGGYSPSLLPWRDHGRTQASELPSCNCQRAASGDTKPTSKSNKSNDVLNLFFIVFMATLLGILQLFVYKTS